FLAAAGEFAGGAADLFLGAFAFGDVLDGAFVIKQLALRIADGAAVFRDPDDRSVLAINLGLEAAQGVVLVHEPDKFLAASVLDVKAVGDVLDARHQLHRRVVTVNPRQRDVRQQVVAADRGAENAFHQMIEDAVVIIFLLDQRQPVLLAGDGTMNGMAQHRGGQLFASKIFLRAAENRLGQKRVVLAWPDDQHRQARRLGGQRSDLKERGSVGVRHLEHQRVKLLVATIASPASAVGSMVTSAAAIAAQTRSLMRRAEFSSPLTSKILWGPGSISITNEGKYNFHARPQARCVGVT